MSSSDVTAFIDKLKNDSSFRKQLMPSLKNVEEGDWYAVVEIAGGFGFHFTVDELIKGTPNGFFKDNGRRPDLGWVESTKNL
jgi:predicted ribosomally synthesized peptide with nif11-like leader